MQTSSSEHHCFEFYFPELDTLVQVDESAEAVVVRATRDTFSDRRKIYFIRELVAEGFIPDSYQWFSLAESNSFRGVRWLVDFSWVKLSEAAVLCARRFVIRLLSGAAILWLVLMMFIFLG